MEKKCIANFEETGIGEVILDKRFLRNRIFGEANLEKWGTTVLGTLLFSEKEDFI